LFYSTCPGFARRPAKASQGPQGPSKTSQNPPRPPRPPQSSPLPPRPSQAPQSLPKVPPRPAQGPHKPSPRPATAPRLPTKARKRLPRPANAPRGPSRRRSEEGHLPALGRSQRGRRPLGALDPAPPSPWGVWPRPRQRFLRGGETPIAPSGQDSPRPVGPLWRRGGRHPEPPSPRPPAGPTLPASDFIARARPSLRLGVEVVGCEYYEGNQTTVKKCLTYFFKHIKFNKILISNIDTF
jgi:hypothetical protein